jgi:hypothetical protein
LETHIELEFIMYSNHVASLPLTLIPNYATLWALLTYNLVEPLEYAGQWHGSLPLSRVRVSID